MIVFLLAPACYMAVVEITRVWGIFARVSKALLVFIGMLLHGCLLNFVDEPPNLVACGAMISWIAIIVCEVAIYFRREV